MVMQHDLRTCPRCHATCVLRLRQQRQRPRAHICHQHQVRVVPHQQPSARRAGANLTGSLLGSRAAVRLMRAAGGAAARLPHLQHGLQRLGRAPLAHGRHAQEQQDRAHRADRRAGAGAARRRRAPLARVHPALASRAWVVRPGARQARAKWSPALGVPCSVHIGAHKRR